MSDETPQSTDELGFRILRSLRRILRRVSAYSRHVGRETGLGVPQLLCMHAIARDEADEVTVARVADQVQLSRSTVSTLVEKLVQADLVSRVRSQRDRRRVHLSLTSLGSTTLQSMPRPLEERFLSRLKALEPTTREQILSSLQLVVDLMDAETLDASPLLDPHDRITDQEASTPDR